MPPSATTIRFGTKSVTTDETTSVNDALELIGRITEVPENVTVTVNGNAVESDSWHEDVSPGATIVFAKAPGRKAS